ncbi:MAG TPA: NUDIX domain-containing protein [Propylenella sp.]|nr:NUDIX domain-containing protein [Propylenella sp.]
MAARRSAGILLYRKGERGLLVLLVHPGGPYWARKDVGAWSIPKGEYVDGDDPQAAALREFEEELGSKPAGTLVALGDLTQKGGKHVTAFALEGNLDPPDIVSNTFELEWPPRSGRRQLFPEVDRAEWFSLDDAREKILASQRAFLDRLAALIAAEAGDDRPGT